MKSLILDKNGLAKNVEMLTARDKLVEDACTEILLQDKCDDCPLCDNRCLQELAFFGEDRTITAEEYERYLQLAFPFLYGKF